MQKNKSKLEALTAKEIETITKKSRRSKDVPLVVSKATPIVLDEELNAKVEVLSSVQGVKPDAFVNKLLKGDIDRLWKKYKHTG
jgi:hypothetical protein